MLNFFSLFIACVLQTSATLNSDTSSMGKL